MIPVFIDTNIPMYAAGKPHPLRAPAQAVINAIVEDEIDAVTDAEVFQEILYRYWHISAREKGLLIFDHFYRVMLGKVLPVTTHDVLLARELLDQFPTLPPRDVIHLAVMRRNEINFIISADKDFDDIPGIQRIDPKRIKT